MLTSSPMTVLTGRLNAFYKTVESELSSSLTKVASGKRVASPFDNITDYFHAKNYNRQSTDYGRIRSDVAETSAMLDVASNVGEQVFDGLSKMRFMVDNYYDPDATAEDKAVIQAEFNAVAKEVAAAISNGNYDGKQLVADTSVTGPLKTVNLDPRDFTNTFKIDFTASQVADTSSLVLGSGNAQADADAVQAELDKAGSYLASVSAYNRGIKAQYNIATNNILASKSAESVLTDGDTATQVAKATKDSIRQQSAAAMIAQANMMRSQIVKVLQF